MGIVSALGNNVEENLHALRANRSGIAPLRYLRTSHTEFPVGEVKMTDEEMISLLKIPENKPITRTSLMGMLAVREALESAGLRCAMCDVRQSDVRCETTNISRLKYQNLTSQISKSLLSTAPPSAVWTRASGFTSTFSTTTAKTPTSPPTTAAPVLR